MKLGGGDLRVDFVSGAVAHRLRFGGGRGQALAKAYGAYTATPINLTAMQKAVAEAFSADGPTLIYITPDILAQ